MNGKEFRAALPPALRAQLPESLHAFHHATRFSFVQFWYEEPAFHYEIWPQSKYGVIEIGLHFEHRESARNAAMHRHIDEHLVEIRHLLGEIWLERWDRGWHKIYQTVPLVRFSAASVGQCAGTLARQISVLQPLLDGQS